MMPRNIYAEPFKHPNYYSTAPKEAVLTAYHASSLSTGYSFLDESERPAARAAAIGVCLFCTIALLSTGRLILMLLKAKLYKNILLCLYSTIAFAVVGFFRNGPCGHLGYLCVTRNAKDTLLVLAEVSNQAGNLLGFELFLLILFPTTFARKPMLKKNLGIAFTSLSMIYLVCGLLPDLLYRAAAVNDDTREKLFRPLLDHIERRYNESGITLAAIRRPIQFKEYANFYYYYYIKPIPNIILMIAVASMHFILGMAGALNLLRFAASASTSKTILKASRRIVMCTFISITGCVLQAWAFWNVPTAAGAFVSTSAEQIGVYFCDRNPDECPNNMSLSNMDISATKARFVDERVGEFLRDLGICMIALAPLPALHHAASSSSSSS